jgi:DNA-binding transcriptional LysR family regulator
LNRKKSLAPRDLEGRLLIMHEKGSAPRRALEDYIRKNKISVDIHLEISSNKAIKRAVEDDLGIALISRRVVIDEIKAGRLSAIPLSDRSMNRKFYMVHHKDKYLSEPLQRFMEKVFEWAAEYTGELK